MASSRPQHPCPHQVVTRGVSEYAYPSAPELPPREEITEAAKRALTTATTAVKRLGWISFWVQMTLSVVSAVILLFSVAFTSQVSGEEVGGGRRRGLHTLIAFPASACRVGPRRPCT